jgi:translation initiation factor 1 (eIF-1/SUI1)
MEVDDFFEEEILEPMALPVQIASTNVIESTNDTMVSNESKVASSETTQLLEQSDHIVEIRSGDKIGRHFKTTVKGLSHFVTDEIAMNDLLKSMAKKLGVNKTVDNNTGVVSFGGTFGKQIALWLAAAGVPREKIKVTNV